MGQNAVDATPSGGNSRYLLHSYSILLRRNKREFITFVTEVTAIDASAPFVAHLTAKVKVFAITEVLFKSPLT